MYQSKPSSQITNLRPYIPNTHGQPHKYDQFGNPLWVPTLGGDIEAVEERLDDVRAISNITSTYINDAKSYFTDSAKAKLLTSLVAVKDLIREGDDPDDVPSLAELHEALELKQKLAKAEEQYVKKYQDGFYVNPKGGNIRYFDGEQLKYVETRKVTPIPNTDLLIYPIEHKTVDGHFTMYTVQLPEPESKLGKNKKEIVCHELIGYREIPQMGIGIDEMDARVIAFGSGKIPLANLDHYEKWCSEAQEIYEKTGTIPDFNDLVWLMKDNKICLKYDPYNSGSFTPLIPCKGVYSRQVIKKKPKYSMEYRNESVFQTFTGTGTTYNIKDPHTGIGIVCFEDIINIVGSHKCYSQDTDYEKKAKISKIELILRQVKVEKEDEKDWGDVWDYVLKSQLQSDVLYTGSVTLGPNFNPRPENVMIMQEPVKIQNTPTATVDRINEYVAPEHEELAATVREQHPLNIPPETVEHMEVTPDITTDQSKIPEHQALPDEHIINWAERAGHLSAFDAPALQQMFDGFITQMSSLNNDPTKITSAQVMKEFMDAFDTQLMSRNRSEVMFTQIAQNTNQYAGKIPGMSHQIMYDHRFRPFIECNLNTSRALLRYTSEGLEEMELKHVLDFTKLSTGKTGTDGNERDIHVFKRHGDMFRTMFAKVENGKIFEDVVHLTSLLIEFYSVKLAETDIIYPTYKDLMENKSPEKWRSDITLKPFWPPFDIGDEWDTYDSHFKVNFLKPNVEQKRRAYESVLTWHALTALILIYLKHDSSTMKGQNASEATTEFRNSDAVQMMLKCPATISSGAAYFDKYADCPLLCQYGEIGGLPPSGEYMLQSKNFIAVQDAFHGGLVIQNNGVLDEAKHGNPDWGIGQYVVKFDTRVVRYWTFLNLTYNESLKRTNFGRSLLLWNEIFRGETFAMDFLKSMGTRTISDSVGNQMHTERIIEIPQGTEISKVIGVESPGPLKLMTPQRLVAMHDISKEANYQTVIDKSGPQGNSLEDWWGFYYNMFAKQAVWSNQFLYSNYVAPNFPPWETHEGDQTDYTVTEDYLLDDDHVTKYPVTREEDRIVDGKTTKETVVNTIKYLPNTAWLATQTFNHSDFLLSGGDFSLQGSGMYLINKVIPAEDSTWYNAQPETFKSVFTSGDVNGWNYMSVMRPFGKYLWVNDDEVDMTDYFRRPYFMVGNRPAHSNIPELED